MNNNNKWQYLLRQYSGHYANNINIYSQSSKSVDSQQWIDNIDFDPWLVQSMDVKPVIWRVDCIFIEKKICV